MPRIDNIAPHGSARYHKGDVILSLSNGSLGVYRGSVTYYDSPNSIVLNAIFVADGNRGNGLGSMALLNLMEALRECGFKGGLYCEPCPIGSRTAPLNVGALAAWYKRHGFTDDSDGAGCVYVLQIGEENGS